MSTSSRPEPGEDLPNGWVWITLPARLWESVPVDERVTEADVLRVQWVESAIEKRVSRMRHPECEIGVKATGPGITGKWWPCPNEVYDNGRRCSKHGGPTKAPAERVTIASLRAENAELQRRLADLESSRSSLICDAESGVAL